MWAILSDIHGNLVALDAVLADARSQGADQWIVAGDMCAFGPEPLACLERVIGLPGVRFVQGNTDRYIVEGLWLFKKASDERQAVMMDNLRWCSDMIGREGTELLARLPQAQRFLDALVVHASPGDDELGMRPELSDDELSRYLGLAEGASTLIGGHTHVPFIRELPAGRVINLGSAGFPFDGNPDPSYLLTDGARWELRRVPYDRMVAEARIRQSGMPFADGASRRVADARP